MLSNKKQYDKFARDFVDKSQLSNNKSKEVLYHSLNSLILKGKKILDVGCGYGEDLEYFSKFDCETFGVDGSKKMVNLARKKSPSSKIILGNFEKPFFQKEEFDIITSRYAIQHAENVGKVLMNIKKVLKIGGELIIFVTHPFRQYFEKKKKDYWFKEIVKSKIFNKTLIVEEPAHTTEEYFNKNFVEDMKLICMQEIFDSVAEEIKGAGKYPSALLLHFKKQKLVRKKISVVGSATHKKISKNILNKIISKFKSKNVELSTGAAIGIPHQIVKASVKQGIKCIGYSPTDTEIKHNKGNDNASLKDFSEIKFISGFTRRSSEMIEECDALLVLGGRMGTLSEFCMAFEEQKPIAVLTSSGEISQHIKAITKLTNKHRKVPVFFNDDIEKLLDNLFEYLK